MEWDKRWNPQDGARWTVQDRIRTMQVAQCNPIHQVLLVPNYRTFLLPVKYVRRYQVTR